MAVFNLTALRAALPRGQRLIGLDPGAKLIGLAMSEGPKEPSIAGGLVIGLPLSMDGSFGPAAQAAKDFGRDLAAAAGLDVAFWDERLSSAAVNRAMIEADLSRAKRAERVDAAAAAWMLQGALDATAGQG